MGRSWYEQRRQEERRNTIIGLCIAGCVVAAIVVTLVLVFRTRTAHYKVTAAQWIATTNIRQKTLAHADDWCPPDHSSAFNIKRERRLYDTYDCNCITIGGDEMGIGGTEICSTCEDYRDYCTYDWWDWPVIRTKSNTGCPEDRVKHPILSFEPPDQRSEMLTEFPVLWKNEEGEVKPYKARDIQELRQYNTGEWWEIDVNYAGKFEPKAKALGETE